MPQSYVTLSHLWPSVAHESARVETVDEMGATRVGERPQPERTIDVEPAVARRDPVGDLVERVERPVFTSPA